jgi:hypothetical protein
MKTFPASFVWAAFSLAATLLFTGCVGVLPRPVSATKVDYGHRLPTKEAAFIQPGVTTRAEVISRLGTNYVSLPSERAIAYSWEMKGGGAVWWCVIVSPYGAIAESGDFPGGWRAFFVAFDDRGVVTSTAFKSPSTRHSLHEHMHNWVKTLPDHSLSMVASNQ